jgi:ketopantoate hydroxymethyltransferase
MTTIHDLAEWKRQGRRFTMLTAYDFPTAQILDQAGIPVLLVGDSVANNILGYDSTLPVTMEEMLHHARAVSRGAREALLVGDMPSCRTRPPRRKRSATPVGSSRRAVCTRSSWRDLCSSWPTPWWTGASR